MKTVERGLGYLARRGLRDGLVGGSNAWAAAGAAALVLRWIRRSGGPKVVYSERLRPGESIVITHGAAATGRRGRR